MLHKICPAKYASQICPAKYARQICSSNMLLKHAPQTLDINHETLNEYGTSYTETHN